MSSWHRENPELIGTHADPWMRSESYRKAVLETERECFACGRFAKGVTPDGLCPRCESKRGAE